MWLGHFVCLQVGDLKVVKEYTKIPELADLETGWTD